MVEQRKERKVGTVEHYYPKVHAAAVRLDEALKVGDTIHIKGHGDDLRETVTSLQLDHAPIAEARPGQSVGVEVKWKVHEKAEVFKVDAPKAKPRKAAKKAAKKPAKAAKPAKKPVKKPGRPPSAAKAARLAKAKRAAKKR